MINVYLVLTYLLILDQATFKILERATVSTIITIIILFNVLYVITHVKLAI